MMALFPIPVTITLPLQAKIADTISTKSSLMYCKRFKIASDSNFNVVLALSIIDFLLLKENLLVY